MITNYPDNWDGHTGLGPCEEEPELQCDVCLLFLPESMMATASMCEKCECLVMANE